MSVEGLTVLDGTRLKTIQSRLPVITTSITGAKLIDIANSEASSSLFGISLPETLKSNALKRLNVDDVSFSSKEFDAKQASEKLGEYLTAIADELQDDPLVVSVLDGSPIKLFLEDEDDFAMLAENLFTDLDVKDTGKIKRNEIRNALENMGVEMGVPPFSEFPVLNDILKKRGAEGGEELGQAQFAESLQFVLQDLADALAEKHIVLIQNIKIINGSKLRKLLADEKQLNNVLEKMFHEIDAGKGEKGCTETIKAFLQKNGSTLGLLPPETNEAIVFLYDQVFSDVDSGKNSGEVGKDEFGILVKDILGKFAEHLEVNPIFHDTDLGEICLYDVTSIRTLDSKRTS